MFTSYRVETLESIAEIKNAVNKGRKVYCGNSAYLVIKDKVGQWLIKCSLNGYCIGLHGQVGTDYENQLNGENFYTEYSATYLEDNLVESLRRKIYESLIANPDYGLGEVNECRDEAARIVADWMDENNLVEIEPEPQYID
jgi:hypothetical protein